MKLNKLGFRKVDVDQNDILHKREMKEILGGVYCSVCVGNVCDSGPCGSSSIDACNEYCKNTHYDYCSCGT